MELSVVIWRGKATRLTRPGYVQDQILSDWDFNPGLIGTVYRSIWFLLSHRKLETISYIS